MGLLFAFMPVLAGNTGSDSASRLEVVQLLVRCAADSPLQLTSFQMPMSLLAEASAYALYGLHAV